MIIENQKTKINKWEYLLPVLATLSLIVSSVIVSNKKFFWNDEFLSFYLLSDPSFGNMLSAWADTINQAPPLYFILGWLWSKMFGATEVSLRLFSSITICLAFTIIWLVIRNIYDFWSTSIGTLSVFCLSGLILEHNAEVRMYGLFTAVCALGLLCFDFLNRKKKISLKHLSVNTLIHGLIVLTHLYGGFYSAAILAANLISDIYFHKLKLNVYLSIICGWLFLLPLVPSLIHQSNNHANWFSLISASQAFNYFLNFTPKFALLIFSFLLISIFLHLFDKNSSEKTKTFNVHNETYFKSEFYLLILAGTFIAVPILAWIINQKIRPIFGERYIIPTITISWSILLSYLFTKIIPNSYLERNLNIFATKKSIILLTIAVFILMNPVKYAMNIELYLPKSYLNNLGIEDDSYGYIELPIATEAGHNFLPRFYYSPNGQRYFHIRDWETALKNKESAFATGDYTIISALKRHYNFINSIQSKDFLHKYNRFLVLNEPKNVISWFEERIENNSSYQTKLLGKVDGGYGSPLELFLVESKSPTR